MSFDASDVILRDLAMAKVKAEKDALALYACNAASMTDEDMAAWEIAKARAAKAVAAASMALMKAVDKENV